MLGAVRYGETSKVVRLATRALGVQSVIAKGALRPRSRFGAALQLLSEGQAQFRYSDRRDLHLLTAFDVTRLHVGLTDDYARFTAATALAEVMMRFAPPEPHEESYLLLQGSLGLLEQAPASEVDAVALRMLWRLIAVLGFGPSLDRCARDGEAVAPSGQLPFSTRDGGALCPRCAGSHGATRLPPEARDALVTLLDPQAGVPELDRRNRAAHRRLLARYIRYHLGEGAELPALELWQRPRPRKDS